MPFPPQHVLPVAMRESDAAAVLLVRSVEESGKGVLTPAQLAEGSTAAGEFENYRSWFLRRATYLLEKLPPPYRSLMATTRIVEKAGFIVIPGAFILGLASNYLGPTGKIPILFNPLMALVAWNLLIYCLLILVAGRRFFGAFHRGRDRQERSILDHPVGDTDAASRTARPKGEVAREGPRASRPLALKLIYPIWRAWLFLHTIAADVRQGARKTSGYVQTARTFWAYWLDLSRKVLALRVERVLHAGAIALTTGVILGMYFRGLVLDYNVVWRSTFIRDEKTIGHLISFFFGPAAWLSGINLSANTNTSDLMGPTGSPAAPWIHLYAVTALVFIAAPRLLLYLSDSLRIRRQADTAVLVFQDDYYRSRIRDAMEAWRADISGKIREHVRIARTAFSGTIASYVCERLYDGQIVPAIDEFRQRGGSLTALEDRIRKTSREFIPDLNKETQSAQKHFEEVLSGSIEQVLGKRLAFESGIRGLDGFGRNSSQTGGVIDSLGESFTKTVGIAVSAAVAAVLGTVSGGFGKTLGAAILVALFHTTGPIGYLIGAISGLLMAYGTWYFGRQKLTEAVKQVTIPGFVVRTILWRSRLDRIKAEGRAQACEAIQEELDKVLCPLDQKIADEIWRRIRGAVPGLQ